MRNLPNDRDTLIVGLASIGIRLYEQPDDPGEPAIKSIAVAERVVWARMFMNVWERLDEVGRVELYVWTGRHGWADEFDRALADAQRRATDRLLDITFAEARAALGEER
jgi:hypothetical protein